MQVAATGETESGDSEPLTEVKEEALTEMKEEATRETGAGDSEPPAEAKEEASEEALTEMKEEATRESGPGDSEPSAEAKEEASEEAPAAPLYDYEVLPHNRDGATEEQIAMAKKVLDQNADIPAVYIVGGLYLSEEWRADKLSENGERKVTVRRIIKKKGS